MKEKETFSIDRFIEVLKKHYKNWDAPVITLMSHEGASPFEILISTLLSLRTRDEVTAEASKRLFKIANTPEKILKLDEELIAKTIYPVGFYPSKSKNIIKISKILIKDHKGLVPDSMEELLKLPGVGRKTANLVIVEAFGQKGICVDTHVHRISNRIGYVKTKTADKTEMALREKLPEKYWVSYNEMLVALGQIICRPISPFCNSCPLAFLCPKIGVEKSR